MPNLRQGFVLAAIITAPAWITCIAAVLIPTVPAGALMVLTVCASIVSASQVFPQRGIGLMVCCLLASLAAIPP